MAFAHHSIMRWSAPCGELSMACAGRPSRATVRGLSPTTPPCGGVPLAGNCPWPVLVAHLGQLSVGSRPPLHHAVECLLRGIVRGLPLTTPPCGGVPLAGNCPWPVLAAHLGQLSVGSRPPLHHAVECPLRGIVRGLSLTTPPCGGVPLAGNCPWPVLAAHLGQLSVGSRPPLHHAVECPLRGIVHGLCWPPISGNCPWALAHLSTMRWSAPCGELSMACAGRPSRATVRGLSPTSPPCGGVPLAGNCPWPVLAAHLGQLSVGSRPPLHHAVECPLRGIVHGLCWPPISGNCPWALAHHSTMRWSASYGELSVGSRSPLHHAVECPLRGIVHGLCWPPISGNCPSDFHSALRLPTKVAFPGSLPQSAKAGIRLQFRLTIEPSRFTLVALFVIHPQGDGSAVHASGIAPISESRNLTAISVDD